jgi:hypothetical protein
MESMIQQLAEKVYFKSIRNASHLQPIIWSLI